MGCDGGTIPRRDELVRVKKKPEQVNKIHNVNKFWNFDLKYIVFLVQIQYSLYYFLQKSITQLGKCKGYLTKKVVLKVASSPSQDC